MQCLLVSIIYLQDELNHIAEELIQNSFPLSFISERISRMETTFKNDNNSTNNQSQPLIINIQNSNTNITTTQNNQLTIPNNEQNSVSIIPNSNEEKEEFWVPLPLYRKCFQVRGYLRNKLKWKATFTTGVKYKRYR